MASNTPLNHKRESGFDRMALHAPERARGMARYDLTDFE